MLNKRFGDLEIWRDCLRLLSSVCRFNRHGRTYQRERRAATNKEQTIARLVIDVLSASATDAEYIHCVITACRQRSTPPVGSRHVVVILTMTDHDWPRLTTTDRGWLRLTATDHGWPRGADQSTTTTYVAPTHRQITHNRNLSTFPSTEQTVHCI